MKRRTKILIWVGGGLVAAVVAAYVAYVLLRGDSPDAVDLDAAVALAEQSSDDGVPDSDAASGTAQGIDGVWTVSVDESGADLQEDPAVSFVGFRLNEVLAGGVGDFTVVGRTAEVTGSIELSGETLQAATVEATMATLRTDNSHRDSHVRDALGTDTFPTASFTLTEPLEVAGLAEGVEVSGTAQGEMTINGVTQPATFELQAQLVGDRIVAVGSSDVVFADYGVTVPDAQIVISVDDFGIMEFQLFFTR